MSSCADCTVAAVPLLRGIGEQYIASQLGEDKLPISMRKQNSSDDSLGSTYYRHDQNAIRNMGATKALLLHTLLLQGYDVILSDADTVWMNDPWDWIPRLRPDGSYDPLPRKVARQLELADMLFSTDKSDPSQLYDSNTVSIVLLSRYPREDEPRSRTWCASLTT